MLVRVTIFGLQQIKNVTLTMLSNAITCGRLSRLDSELLGGRSNASHLWVGHKLFAKIYAIILWIEKGPKKISDIYLCDLLKDYIYIYIYHMINTLNVETLSLVCQEVWVLVEIWLWILNVIASMKIVFQVKLNRLRLQIRSRRTYMCARTARRQHLLRFRNSIRLEMLCNLQNRTNYFYFTYYYYYYLLSYL